MKELAPRFATYARTIGQSALTLLSSAGVWLVIVWLVIVATARADDAPINPYPRSVIDRSTVAMVDFSQAASADHWKAHNDCTAKIAGGRLVARSQGLPPVRRRVWLHHMMALVTAEASVAVLWSDTALQPIFATPDFFDCTPDHRLALRGKRTEATIRITPGWDDGQRLEETILWTVRHRGLPPLPKPPRSWGAQKRLAMAPLDGPLNGADGWGHCAQARWPRNCQGVEQ